jgi:uncharacterized protein (TIGR00369 family)
MTADPGTSRSIERARARFARVGFARWLGVTVVELEPDRAVLALPHRPEHLNARGVLQGGASASVLTMAGTLAAWTGVDLDADLQLSCVDLSVQYLTAAAEEDVVAEARVLRRGRGLVVVDVALRARDDRPVCQSLLSYQTSDYAKRPPRLWAQPSLLPALTTLTPPSGHRLFTGYVRKLDITPLHHSPGRVRLHMPCTAMHLDEGGQLHAGALASIVDIAAVTASWSLVPRRDGARGSTVGMHVSYPSHAAAAVVADAYVQQRSEELLFTTVDVTTADEARLVAMGRVSYRLLEPWPDESQPRGRTT